VSISHAYLIIQHAGRAWGSGEVGVGVTYWNDRRKSSHKLASGGLCTGTTMGKREICKTRTWRLREIYVYISVLYEYCDGALSVVRSVCDIGLHDVSGFSIMTVSDLKTSVKPMSRTLCELDMSRTVDTVQHNIRMMTGPLSRSFRELYFSVLIIKGVGGVAVGWGTALQAGRSRVRFLTGSLGSFRPHCGAGIDSAFTEVSTRNISWGIKPAGA